MRKTHSLAAREKAILHAHLSSCNFVNYFYIVPILASLPACSPPPPPPPTSLAGRTGRRRRRTSPGSGQDEQCTEGKSSSARQENAVPSLQLLVGVTLLWRTDAPSWVLGASNRRCPQQYANDRVSLSPLPLQRYYVEFCSTEGGEARLLLL